MSKHWKLLDAELQNIHNSLEVLTNDLQIPLPELDEEEADDLIGSFEDYIDKMKEVIAKVQAMY